MIKGQQDISKLRNEMGTVNKAGAGRKFLIAMKQCFERSRKAKFPKGTSHRKDMGIGSSVQSFKPKSTTQSQKTGKSAGVDNLIKEKFGGIERGNPAKVEKGKRKGYYEKLDDQVFALDPGAMEIRRKLNSGKITWDQHIKLMSQHMKTEGKRLRAKGYIHSKDMGWHMPTKKSLSSQLDDINKGLAERLARIGRARKAVQVGSKPMRHLTRRLTHTTVTAPSNTALRNAAGSGDMQKAHTVYPPHSSTQLSLMHHIKPGARQFAGPNISSKVGALRTENARSLPGALQTTKRPALGTNAFQTRQAASKVGAVQAGVRRGKMLRTAGKIGAGAAVVGGGALLARHLMRRHQAKKAARQAATNPAAGSIAQGMMGCLANMQKKLNRMANDVSSLDKLRDLNGMILTKSKEHPGRAMRVLGTLGGISIGGTLGGLAGSKIGGALIRKPIKRVTKEAMKNYLFRRSLHGQLPGMVAGQTVGDVGGGIAGYKGVKAIQRKRGTIK